MIHKNLRTLLVLVLLVALLLPLGVPAVSAAYENTYVNTGNMRDDIIGVALTQVGYTEGANNYTKYGVWYGLPNSPWCGMFVSWCAAQAGIPTSILKRTGIANPSNFGLSYTSGSNYTPQKGDLFFKKGFTHVGLVYYTEGAYFYTVEGNTSTTSYDGTSVMIRKRKISDYYFSSPNYSGSGTSTGGGCNHSYAIGYEAEHPHKEYQVCSKCGKTSYTGNKRTIDSCTLCIQASCNHNFTQWTKVDNNDHTRTCSKCNLKETKTHDWTDGKLIKKATCIEDGIQQLICSSCNAESEKVISKTGVHDFEEVSYLNELKHQSICSVCGHIETAEHHPSTTWQYDTLYHWTSCSDCNGRLYNSEHTYSGGCLAPCDTCGYTQETGHKVSDRYHSDETSHWQVCQRCGLDVDVQAHVYSSECDELCDICSKSRVATAAHNDQIHSNDSGHWNVCSDCSRKTQIVSHTPDTNCEEWEDVLCIHCGYVLLPASRHEHKLHTIEYDPQMHWGTCVCGEVIEPEVHTWNVQTGICSECNASLAAIKADPKTLVDRIWRNIFSFAK